MTSGLALTRLSYRLEVTLATLFTPNYKLDLYAEDDKPNLRDQYNAAMGKIDTELKTLADAAPTGEFAPKVHTSTAYQGAIYGLGGSDVYGHLRLADSAAEVFDSAQGVAATPKAISAYAAPINHASSGNEYGVASETSYGHVKTTDLVEVHADVTNGYWAATPKGVVDYVAAHAGGGGTWENIVTSASYRPSSSAAYSFECEYNVSINKGANLMYVLISLRFLSGNGAHPTFQIKTDLPFSSPFSQYNTVWSWDGGYISLEYFRTNLELYFSNESKQALDWNFQVHSSSLFVLS